MIFEENTKKRKKIMHTACKSCQLRKVSKKSRTTKNMAQSSFFRSKTQVRKDKLLSVLTKLTKAFNRKEKVFHSSVFPNFAVFSGWWTRQKFSCIKLFLLFFFIDIRYISKPCKFMRRLKTYET